MHKRLDRAHRAIPLVLGSVTLISVGVLLTWDFNPKFFPARAHDFLAAFPLAMIAIAYLLYQSARRPAAKEFIKAIMLAVAFLFWAANQLWPDSRQATLFNVGNADIKDHVGVAGLASANAARNPGPVARRVAVHEAVVT
jgi:hypothetical protein